MQNRLSTPWPNFTQEEADAVSSVLLSNRVNYWTGEEGKAFERAFAAFANTNHAIALANGTLALDLALYGLRIGSVNGGKATDEVIVTPRSFIASVSTVVNAGAVPVFVDVDANSGNITPQSAAPAITPNTRAIIAVHLGGWPCDMDGLRDLVASRDIQLIEDCAQAHGALYKGRPVGSLGDVAAWSFCQDKIMTTGGEGGMVTCDDEDLWKRMWAYKDHGKSYDAIYNREHPSGFRWVHEDFGTNWRLTEMQSAIGRIQLDRMPDWHAIRTANALDLWEVLEPFAGPDGPLRLTRPPCFNPGNCDVLTANASCCSHAWYRFYAYVRPEALTDGQSRDSIIARLGDQGLRSMQGSCSEIYRERAFDGHPSRPVESLPVAKTLGETSIMFFTHPGVTKVSVDLS